MRSGKGRAAVLVAAGAAACFICIALFSVVSCKEKGKMPSWAVGLNLSGAEGFGGILRKNGIEMQRNMDPPFDSISFIEFGKEYDFNVPVSVPTGEDETEKYEEDVNFKLVADVNGADDDSFEIWITMNVSGLVEMVLPMRVKLFRKSEGNDGYLVYSQFSEDGGETWAEAKLLTTP